MTDGGTVTEGGVVTGGGADPDEELIAAVAAKSLPLEEFTHPQHVRLAWACLRRWPLLPAMGEFRSLLIGYATHHGASGLYHETVTFAYLLLVYERMYRSPHLHTWPAFAAEHADLLSWRDGPFFRLYRSGILEDREARARFVLPAEPANTDATPMQAR